MTKRPQVWLWIGAGVGLLLAGSCLLLGLGGWRALVVKTPSMGQTAPVGSLVLTRPDHRYQPGEVVSFTHNQRIYTHRIQAIDSEGRLITKGDRNSAPDPWRVDQAAVLGRAHAIIHHAGWVWQALPWLLLGSILVFMASYAPFIGPYWRWPVRIMGCTLVVALVTLWLHPWLRVDLLHYAPDGHGQVAVQVVNTGIFPVRVESERLVSGQDALVSVPLTTGLGQFSLTPRPSLGFWGTLWVLLFCLMPLLIALVVPLPRAPAHPPGHRAARPMHRTRNTPQAYYQRTDWWLAIGIVGLVMVLLAMQLSTLAAFTGSIINSTNSTASRTYFTCRSALGPQASPQPVFAYAMDASGTNQPNLIPGGPSGVLDQPVGSGDMSTQVGCLRDLPKSALRFTDQCLVHPVSINNPGDLSIEVWFRTSSVSPDSGRIVGFGTGTTVNESTSDRLLYIDKAGRVIFGVHQSAVRTVGSRRDINYADNRWHHVVATVSSGGTHLYVDGELHSRITATRGRNITGHWKFGCGNLNGWKHGDGEVFNGAPYYKGHLQYGAVYDTALTAVQVKEHYLAGAD